MDVLSLLFKTNVAGQYKKGYNRIEMSPLWANNKFHRIKHADRAL